MKAWLRNTLIVLGVLVVLYGALVAFASYSNGHKVDATLHVGTNDDGSMYIRCGAVTGATCTGGDHAVLSVAKRDRVKLTVVNDDGGDHTHDFKVAGWYYALPPMSPEMELHKTSQSWTFTAWGSGSFRMWCELSGHAARGMEGRFVVA